MIINQNISAVNTYRQLTLNNMGMAKSMEKLSSGLRINRAGDDAAGLSISEKMRGQIRGLNQASTNAQDAISLIQTAEGALNETHAILQRMRELVVQAANDTLITEDRDAVKAELKQLEAEISRIASTTEFNTQKILDGSFTTKYFQIGANQDQSVILTIATMSAAALGASGGVVVTTGNISTSGGGINVGGYTNATNSIVSIDKAIKEVSEQRSKLGALQNRLEHTIKNLDTAAENLQAAESRIRDTDMAKEMMSFTKFTILNQAATAMLAQANQMPQSVLQLLR